MSYRVELESRARRELFDLPEKPQQAFERIIDTLQNNPRPQGAKKLTGSEEYRIRWGDYRMLYTIDDKSRIVRVYRIGHRKDVYRRR